MREGTDATLVAYGPMVRTCLEAAAAAEADGAALEVVDLRALSPLDLETVLDVGPRPATRWSSHEAPANLGSAPRSRARVERARVLLAGGAGAAGRGLRHPVPAVPGRGGLPARPGPGARRRRPLASGTEDGRCRDVKEFKLPDLGEGLTEGEILQWLVAARRRGRAEPADRRGRDRQGRGRDAVALRRGRDDAAPRRRATTVDVGRADHRASTPTPRRAGRTEGVAEPAPGDGASRRRSAVPRSADDLPHEPGRRGCRPGGRKAASGGQARSRSLGRHRPPRRRSCPGRAAAGPAESRRRQRAGRRHRRPRGCRPRRSAEAGGRRARRRRGAGQAAGPQAGPDLGVDLAASTAPGRAASITRADVQAAAERQRRPAERSGGAPGRAVVDFDPATRERAHPDQGRAQADRRRRWWRARSPRRTSPSASPSTSPRRWSCARG